MKKITLVALCIFPLISCVKTDIVNDRVDPKIFISNPLVSLENGESYQFEVNYFNYVGKKIENPTVSWSSSDPSVLEITDEGIATAISLGEATVMATLTTSEENLTITNGNTLEITLGETEEDPVRFEGMLTTTTSYELEGSFILEILDSGVLRLSLGDDYKADTDLPGLYIFLSNNPESVSDAYEIGAVTVFQGEHFYDLPSSISIYDYSYILYWCNPFSTYVGEGQIQ